MGLLIKCSSMSEAVRTALRNFPKDWEFSTQDLKHDCFRLYPPCRNSLGETFTRRLRNFRHGKDFGLDYEIICIKPAKSRYKKMSIKDAQKWNQPKRVLM